MPWVDILHAAHDALIEPTRASTKRRRTTQPKLAFPRWGTDAAIWTPAGASDPDIALQSRADGYERLTHGRAVILLGRRRETLAFMLRASHQQQLPVLAAVATGTTIGPRWSGLVQQSTELDPAPLIVVLLEEAAPLDRLSDLLGRAPLGVIFAVGAGSRVALPRPWRNAGHSFATRALAQAFGWPTLETPLSALRSAACLRHLSNPPFEHTVVAHADSDLAAQLLAHIGDRHGLELRPTVGPLRRRDQRVKPSRRGENDHGAVATRSNRETTSVVFSATFAARSEDGRLGVVEGPGGLTMPADDETFEALRSLSVPSRPYTRPLPAVEAVAQHESRSSHAATIEAAPRRTATAILAEGRGDLDETDLLEILSAYGIVVPPYQIARSAAAAGTAAKEVGLPVTVRLIGHDLPRAERWGGVVDDIRSEAAARQAFHDVIYALRQSHPEKRATAVLITPHDRSAVTVACGLWFLEAVPLLVATARHHDVDLSPRHVWRCPLTPAGAHTAAAELLSDEAAPWIRASARKQRGAQLATTLRRLSVLAADLAGHLRWLTIDALALPHAERAPIGVVGAVAARRKT